MDHPDIPRNYLDLNQVERNQVVVINVIIHCVLNSQLEIQNVLKPSPQAFVNNTTMLIIMSTYFHIMLLNSRDIYRMLHHFTRCLGLFNDVMATINNRANEACKVRLIFTVYRALMYDNKNLTVSTLLIP